MSEGSLEAVKHIMFRVGLFLAGLIIYVPFNSYGHAETVTSPNHAFSWVSLSKR